ncbi:ANTAR domain-containing protein [Streptomyces olindensis]|uniref:ANTAR domain-containing protein n=1 Tax=Streptomyces olindensis TaxID=358823 RepID=A0ABV2XV33_9ACTN|nr:antitermination regulator [Streptomyces olindensis]
MPEPAYSARSQTQEGAAPTPEDGATPAIPPCTATLDVLPDGDRMLVTLWGELDLGGRRLLPDLYDVLTLSGSGVDLYLDSVGFCDCSGVNVLLDLRTRALDQGKTVVIRSGGRAVERVLDLTGTRELFTDADRADGDGPRAHADQDRLLTEVAQLRRAMQTRPTIDLARGILMASFSLSPEAAWSVLVRTSQNTNTKLHHLARDLVGTVHGSTLPEQVRRQLAAAVAGTGARGGTEMCHASGTAGAEG